MNANTGPGKDLSSKEWWANFRELLDSESEWPSEYLFKFIAPKERLDDVKGLFGEEKLTVRASSQGNYLSVTAKVVVDSPEEVIAIYTAAGSIDGVISL